MKAVLEGLAYEYLTPIAATGGQSGGLIVNDIAPLLSDYDNEERVVLYIGDHELRGQPNRSRRTPSATSRSMPGAPSTPRRGRRSRSPKSK